jgi:cell division septation protein DedD
VTDLYQDLPDDGFHEIQLSGKQLVFLFMATTVVSVVIFLCGVLVGRGVRGEGISAADKASASGGATAGPNLTAGTSTPAPPPTVADTPGAPNSSLSYARRLEAEKPVTETVKTPAPEAAAPPAPTSAPAAEPAKSNAAPVAKAEAASKPEPAPATAPAQPGVWAVQVVALTDRAAATAVLDRLRAKGYQAFLVTPRPNAPVQNYKVQVGRFADRAEAEQVAGRLKNEEQFEPWILR